MIERVEQRLLRAQSEVRRLTDDIRYHDRQASELRRQRALAKAKAARAHKAIERAHKLAQRGSIA